jgi:hypothetical protein
LLRASDRQKAESERTVALNELQAFFDGCEILREPHRRVVMAHIREPVELSYGVGLFPAAANDDYPV